MIHYHGTPLSPVKALLELQGCHFCVSHPRPADVVRVHQIGQSVMLDNGAFSTWRRGAASNWPAYYRWCDRWLSHPTTWAVIPDVIDGGPQLQDDLLHQWPFGQRGAPVWHMDEPIDRLLKLIEHWPRVCVGSTKQYALILSPAWKVRMDAVWDAVAARHRHLPWLHMLRGMQLAGGIYPFASVDSTDVARNHNRPQNTPSAMARRWDARQAPACWQPSPQPQERVA